jgi:hypothetical protein
MRVSTNQGGLEILVASSQACKLDRWKSLVVVVFALPLRRRHAGET